MARPRKQTYPLKTYLEEIKSGNICNDADVQRNFVWGKEQINELIYTVLTDDYIPPIILGEEDSTQLHIADGGQRSAALRLFRYGNYRITSSIENSIIEYRRRIKDTNGNIYWEDMEYNIKNKTFEKLPEELKKKFDNYQLDTVIHEHCDRHKISKYIKRYNMHTSMNTNQKGFTYIDNFAQDIREILDSKFFTDCNDYSNAQKDKGGVERVVVETIMCSHHLNDWKSDMKGSCKYLNKNADRKEFKEFDDNLRRLEAVLDDETKDIFNFKDSFLFLALFNKFAKMGFPDTDFVGFLKKFKKELRKNRRNDNDLLFDEIDKEGGTKDKSVVLAKLDMLTNLMNEYLHIEQVPSEYTDDNCVDYISNITGVDKSTLKINIERYIDMLENKDYGLKFNCIKDGSKLLEKNNNMSMLAMVAYAESINESLDEWLTGYAAENKCYYTDQKQNYMHMKNDFDSFIKKYKVA